MHAGVSCVHQAEKEFARGMHVFPTLIFLRQGESAETFFGILLHTAQFLLAG